MSMRALLQWLLAMGCLVLPLQALSVIETYEFSDPALASR